MWRLEGLAVLGPCRRRGGRHQWRLGAGRGGQQDEGDRHQHATFEGTYSSVRNARNVPKPIQQHLDVWLGGIAPSELKRVGRLADGWLPSFVTPDDVARGREVIEQVAAEHGRQIDPEHFGALIPYATGPVPDTMLITPEGRPISWAASASMNALSGASSAGFNTTLESVIGPLTFASDYIDQLGRGIVPPPVFRSRRSSSSRSQRHSPRTQTPRWAMTT